MREDFESDLAKAFEGRWDNDEFCQRVWSSLTNTAWIRKKDGLIYEASFRYIGGLIADLRGKGSYLDWYCKSPYGYVDEEVEEELGKLGWCPLE